MFDQLNVVRADQLNIVHADQLNIVHADQLNVVHAGQLNVGHAGQLNVRVYVCRFNQSTFSLRKCSDSFRSIFSVLFEKVFRLV